MMIPLEWTCKELASKLRQIKIARPAGAGFSVRIEIADDGGNILGSTIGTGATVFDAIDCAELALPEGFVR